MNDQLQFTNNPAYRETRESVYTGDSGKMAMPAVSESAVGTDIRVIGTQHMYFIGGTVKGRMKVVRGRRDSSSRGR